MFDTQPDFTYNQQIHAKIEEFYGEKNLKFAFAFTLTRTSKKVIEKFLDMFNSSRDHLFHLIKGLVH